MILKLRMDEGPPLATNSALSDSESKHSGGRVVPTPRSEEDSESVDWLEADEENWRVSHDAGCNLCELAEAGLAADAAAAAVAADAADDPKLGVAAAAAALLAALPAAAVDAATRAESVARWISHIAAGGEGCAAGRGDGERVRRGSHSA